MQTLNFHCKLGVKNGAQTYARGEHVSIVPSLPPPPGVNYLILYSQSVQDCFTGDYGTSISDNVSSNLETVCGFVCGLQSPKSQCLQN